MTLKLYPEASVQAIAAAIRAKTGKTETMTVADMPAEIAGIQTGAPKTCKEVWLHCGAQQTYTPIDTGVAGDFEHTIEVIGYGNLYSTSCLFSSLTTNQSRQAFDLITSSNKIRFAWGNSGLKSFEYPITDISCWMPMKVRFNKDGFTIDGFGSSYAAAQVTGDYGGAATGGGSAANYLIFGKSGTSTAAAPWVFRGAKILGASGDLLHHFVPVLYGDWTLALLDKVTGAEQVLPSGADGFEGYWAPHTDSLVGITA